MRDRIKFYSNIDMSIGHYVNRIIEYLDKLDMSISYVLKPNDILEFYNITKYSKLKNTTLKSKYTQEIKFLFKEINFFINNISELNFSKIYRRVDREYLDDFWELIDNNLDNILISDKFFKRILNYKRVHITYVLKCKKISKKYESAIRRYLITFDQTVELLINEYASIHDSTYKKLYFPKFSNNECKKIFERYINSQVVHLNYLQVIPDLNCEEILLDDKTKLLALKKAKEEQNKLFNEKNSFKYGSQVAFGEFDEVTTAELKDGDVVYKYSTKWIKENLDFPTLMNNFIYIFEFVDKQMRFLNVSKKSELSIFETIMGVHLKDEYIFGMTFKVKEMTMLMQMLQYNNELKKHELSIEKCIEWFYTEYLKDEFGVQDYLVYMPSDNANYFEKCRIIFPEIDGIIKQFSIFQENKVVDHDLLEISSSSVPFDNIKSLLKKKYVYSNNDKILKLNHLLFSNQCMLHYIEGYEKYDTFLQLILKENIPYSAFKDYQKDDLDWLIECGYVKKDRKGFIKFKDIKKISILFDLYENEVVSYYHYSKDLRKTIDKLVKDGICYFENTLLTKPEVRYLNYYLNNRMVSNGLSIRNRYGHGTQPRKDNEELHHQNYIYLLYIIVLLSIKINDDFCLFDKHEK